MRIERFEIPWNLLTVTLNLHFWRVTVKKKTFTMDDGLHDPHHTKAEFSYYFIIHFEYFYILLKTFRPPPPPTPAESRLLTVLYFPVRSSRSSAMRYGRPSWMSRYTHAYMHTLFTRRTMPPMKCNLPSHCNHSDDDWNLRRTGNKL